MEDKINTYIKTLSEEDVKMMLYAKKILGMTFDIKKSNGYLKWEKDNDKN